MPRTQRPTFLKRQKEQQRKAKAQQKRDARRARKHGSITDEESNLDIDTAPTADETPTESEDSPNQPVHP